MGEETFMPENNKKHEVKGYSMRISKADGTNVIKSDFTDKDNEKFRFDEDGPKSIKDIVSATEYDGLKHVKEIFSITEYYALNNSTIAPPDDSAFSTIFTEPMSSNKYVWSYELIRYTDNSTYKTTKHIAEIYQDDGYVSGSSPVATLIGGVAGVLASTAMGYFLKGNAPVFDLKLKNVVTSVGLGLVGSAVGTLVSKDVAETVDGTIDIVEEFRKEVAARKAGERHGQ